MNNIIIKKLEDTIFDSNKEALDRLNELGRNSVSGSDQYKDLANKVRGTCPCHCFISTDKRLKVEVKRNYTYSKIIRMSYDGEETYAMSMITDAVVEVIGEGYIEKGDTSCTLNTKSHFVKYGTSSDNQATWDTTACPDEWVESTTSFSLKFEDDGCSILIFNCNPPLSGKAYDSYPGASEDKICREINQGFYIPDESVVTRKINGIDATSTSSPIGGMSISYEYYNVVKDQTAPTNFEETTISYNSSVYVTISDASQENILSTYSNLYDELNKNLK